MLSLVFWNLKETYNLVKNLYISYKLPGILNFIKDNEKYFWKWIRADKIYVVPGRD